MRKSTAGIPLKSQKRINTLSKDNVNSQEARVVEGEEKGRMQGWKKGEGCGGGGLRSGQALDVSMQGW